MANSCLITKLKSVVQNDKLSKLGVVRFSINVTNLSTSFRIHAYENNKSFLTIITKPEGGQITGKGTSFYVDNSNASYTFSVLGKYTIEISDKYNIRDLYTYDTEIETLDLKYSLVENIHMENNVSGDVNNLNLSQGKYIRIASCRDLTGLIDDLNIPATLTTLSLNETGVSGSLNVFRDNTNIAYIMLDRCNVGGDISSISGCSSLNTLIIRGTQVSGSLASLLDNGSLKNPSLKSLNVNSTPNLTKNAEDIAILRSLGVTVTV